MRIESLKVRNYNEGGIQANRIELGLKMGYLVLRGGELFVNINI
jgi:hypothetical protein